jgi:uncharacterized protein
VTTASDRSELLTVNGPPHAVERSRAVMVEMPDGRRLAADIWRPSGAGPLPVLLQRLPYGRAVASSPVLPHPAQLARLGYAVVVQDVRGTGDSEGAFVPFAEAEDGAATVEWLARQPFCTGDVAMYGFSYQGLAQLQAAALRPAGLRAIAPMMCAAEPYEFVYEHGCLHWEFVATWAGQLADISSAAPGAPATEAQLDALPRTAALGAHPPSWFLDWLAHERRDGYWEQSAPDLRAIDVPIFTVIGYADIFAAASTRLLSELDPVVVCGPWAHLPWGSRLGDLELGPDAGPQRAIDGFVAFLAEVLPPGVFPPGSTDDADRAHPPAEASAGYTKDRRSRAAYYVIGDGWRQAPSWPPAGDRLRLVGASRAGANSRHGDGRLVSLDPDDTHPAEVSRPLRDVLVAEPLVPVPASGTDAEHAYPDVGATEDRRDVLCYTAEPYPAPLTVVGRPAVRVTARADTTDFDLMAALVIVDGGSARRIAFGAHRFEPYAAEVPVEAVIELSPIAWLIPAGSRIRLDMAASQFPLYARNPQIGGGPAATRSRSEQAVATLELLSLNLDLEVLP